MATTVVATGKIEVQRRKQQPIPVGWALDENGIVTTNANEAFDVQKLLPLGGSEITSGYKGILIRFDILRLTSKFKHPLKLYSYKNSKTKEFKFYSN